MTFLDEYHEWNDVTGALPKGTSWDYEIESIFEDADKRVEAIAAELADWKLAAGVAASDIIERDARVKALESQDELHWRTRKSHLKHIAKLEAALRQIISSDIFLEDAVEIAEQALKGSVPETPAEAAARKEWRDSLAKETPAEWGCSHTTNNGDRCVLPAGHGGNHSL